MLPGWVSLTENDLAARASGAQRATRLGQLYGDARFWVGQEESLERKYRLEQAFGADWTEGIVLRYSAF